MLTKNKDKTYQVDINFFLFLELNAQVKFFSVSSIINYFIKNFPCLERKKILPCSNWPST